MATRAFVGSGTVTVGAGGLLITDGTGIAAGSPGVAIGAGTGSAGVLNVTGAGAVVNSNNGTILVGGLGTGTLDLGTGGTVIAGAVKVGTAGSIALSGGTLASSSLALAFGTTLSSYGKILGSIANNGTMQVTGGSLTLNGSISGTGTIALAAGSTLVVDGSLGVGQNIVFGAGAPETLVLAAPALSLSNGVTGLAVGDRIELGGGIAITGAAVVNGNTIAASFKKSGIPGIFDLTTVFVPAGVGEKFSVGVDASTGDSHLQVASVAAPPTISGAVAAQTGSDQQPLAPLSKVVIADPNANQIETVTVTLSAAGNGTLSNLGGGSYSAASGVYSDTGSAAAVSAALDGLLFTPTPHQVSPGQSVATGFTILDVDTAGAYASNAAAGVTAIAPVASGTTWTVSTATTVANILNNGTIAIAKGGSLDVSTAINPSSSGLFQLATRGTLEIGAILGSGLKIQFAGNAGANDLIVDGTANFGIHVGTRSYAGPTLENCGRRCDRPPEHCKQRRHRRLRVREWDFTDHDRREGCDAALPERLTWRRRVPHRDR